MNGMLKKVITGLAKALANPMMAATIRNSHQTPENSSPPTSQTATPSEAAVLRRMTTNFIRATLPIALRDAPASND